MTRTFPRSGSTPLSPQYGQHCGETGRLLNIAAAIPYMLCLAACSSGSGSSLSNAPDQASTLTSEVLLQSNVQVTVEPALSPNFQPSIHDYVLDCNPSPSVQFTAQIGDGMEVAVNGVPIAPLGQTARATVPLAAGQRLTFTFAFAGSKAPLEYSVRCLPTGFPPISTSVTFNRRCSGTLLRDCVRYQWHAGLVDGTGRRRRRL
jgi:hypothetical protein